GLRQAVPGVQGRAAAVPVPRVRARGGYRSRGRLRDRESPGAREDPPATTRAVEAGKSFGGGSVLTARGSASQASSSASPSSAVRCAIYTRKSVRKKAKASKSSADDGRRIGLAGDDEDDERDPYTTCDAQRDLCARHCASLGW